MDEQGNELVLPKVPFRTPSSSIMFTYPLKSTISDTTIGANGTDLSPISWQEIQSYARFIVINSIEPPCGGILIVSA